MKMHQAIYTDSKKWNHLPDTKIWNNSSTIIFAFASPLFENQPEIFKEFAAKFPKATIVGCSTSGEIHDTQVSDMSVTATFLQLEDSKFKIHKEPIQNITESKDLGVKLSSQLQAKDLKGLVIFSDGLAVNGSQLVEGVRSIIDTSKVTIGGGLAGDGNNFRKTYLVHNGNIVSNCAIAVGFYGDQLDISASSRGGWDIFGPNRSITRSAGNELFEIDGRPALDLYKEYLGDLAKDLPASGLLFPLEVSPPDAPEKKIVRTILAINEAHKSLIFAGDVPTGWAAQLMRANFDRIISGADSAYENARQKRQEQESPHLILAISCVGRRLVLGERTVEEIEVIAEGMPENSILAGFYSYGEIAPGITGQSCELHNQSMTLFTLSEKQAGQKRKAS